MNRDERLEQLSECVRKGVPLSLSETLAVIDYQNLMKRERVLNSMYRKLACALGFHHPAISILCEDADGDELKCAICGKEFIITGDGSWQTK